MSTEQTNVTKTSKPKANALVTLNPETFVEAVYRPFHERLVAAIKEVSEVEFDIKTTDGFEKAKKCRALMRAIRTEGENERKERKAPIIAIGKLLDTEYEKLKELVLPYETKYDEIVKAEEDRKEAIKLAKIQRESEINARIDAIRQLPLSAINMNSAEVQAEIDRISQIVPSKDEFDDRDVEAESVIEATITQLQSLVSGKQAQEAMAKQMEEQQRELARVDGLKAKVQAIKNLILDSADCETAEQMKKLIQSTESIVIDDSYSELQEEAEAAKQSVITSLSRQYAGLQHAETLAAEAEKAKQAEQPAPILDASAPAVAVIPEGDGVTSEPKPVFAGLDLAKPDSERTETVYFTGKRPTAQEIVQAVAKTFGTDEATAVKWILEADFAELKLAA